MRRFTLPLFFLLSACTTAGVQESKINDDRWEIRVWDQKKCDPDTPTEKCKKIFMPQIKSNASRVCKKRSFEISYCYRKDGVTGDRIACKVDCKS